MSEFLNPLLLNLVSLRDFFGDHVLFTLGLMLLIGYAIGKLCGKIGLPEITGFILAGVLVSEPLLGILPYHMSSSMKIITEVALGLIALTIGSEFSLSKLRRLGSKILVITLAQLFLVFSLTYPAMVAAGLDPAFALIIASIATASSPAVLVAIVQSMRIHGTFVDYLYGVVALLDAGTVVLFGITFSLAAGMLGLTAGGGPLVLLAGALGEVFFSLLGGFAMGILIHLAVRNKHHTNEVMLLTLGITFTVIAGAIVLHLSPLLINMTAGAVLINLSPRHHRIFRIIEPMTPPLYALFFVLAGSELRLSLLTQPSLLILGGVYLAVRALTKYVGVYLGALVSKAPLTVRNYLGLCMFPQAGVSLGLVLFVQASPVSAAMTPEQYGVTATLVNIVLLSVFVNQLIGPPFAKLALKRGMSLEG